MPHASVIPRGSRNAASGFTVEQTVLRADAIIAAPRGLRGLALPLRIAGPSHQLSRSPNPFGPSNPTPLRRPHDPFGTRRSDADHPTCIPIAGQQPFHRGTHAAQA
jgi:hypothetical protein